MIEELNVTQLYSTFFTHQDNPWRNAPSPIRSLFRRSVQIKPLGSEFPQCHKRTFYCGEPRQYEDTYYICNDCEVYFCSSCFYQSVHQEHNHEMYLRDRPIYCECGIGWECNASACCSNHGEEAVNIDEEERKKFIDFFKPVYQILFFLDDHAEFATLFKETEAEISNSMKNWATDSLTYCQIITELYMNEIIVNKQKTTIMQQIITSNIHTQAFDTLQYSSYFRHHFMKIFIKIKDKRNIFSRFKAYYKKFLNDAATLDRLLDEGYFCEQKIAEYINNTSSRKSRKQKQDYLEKVFQCFVQIQENQYISGNFMSRIKEDCLPQMNKKTLLMIIKRLFQIFTIQEKRKQNFSRPHLDIQESVIFLIKGISFWLKQFSQLVQIVPKLKKLGIKSENMEIFVEVLLTMLNNNNMEQNKSLLTLIKSYFMFFALSLSNPENIIDLFWTKLCESHQNDVILRMNNFFNQIIRIEDICKSIKLSNETKIKDFQLTLPQLSQQNQCGQASKKLQTQFLEYIKQKKIITKKEIWKKKRKGELNFSNAAHTIIKFCSFNEKLDSFILKENRNHQDEEIKAIERDFFVFQESSYDGFPFLQKQTNIQKLLSSKLLFPNQHIRQFLSILFQSPSFLKHFKRKYEKILFAEDPEQEMSRNIKFGYYCIFFLKFSQKITKGRNKQVTQEMKKIKNELTYVRFQNLEGSRLIKKVLEIEQQNNSQLNEVEMKQEAEKEIMEQKQQIKDLKLTFSEKRNKLDAKYRLKKKNILEKFGSKSISEPLSENEDVCVLCHEKNKQNKRLIYLGEICQGQSLSCIFYGEENKSKVKIRICFHAMHISCFQNLNKKNGKFNCPLCKKMGNCFFPLQFTNEDEDYNESCVNSVTIALGLHFNHYQHEGLFILLFKHLVESLGLQCLVSPINYSLKKSFNKKVNRYITKLILQMYSNSSERERTKYQKKVQDLMISTEKCINPLLGEIQKFVCEAVWSKAIGSTVDTQLLRKLQRQLVEEEFSILKAEIEQFSQTSFYSQSNQDYGSNRIGLKWIELPEVADTFIKLKQQTCIFCSSRKNQYKCLMCGDVLCKSCYQQHCQRHQKLKCHLSFSYLQLEVEWRVQGAHHSESKHVYFNAYQMSLSDIAFMEQECQTLWLSQTRANFLIQKFLSQQQ